MTSQVKHLKILVVGDSSVGKSCLLMSYTQNEFPNYYTLPTVFEAYTKSITVDGQEYIMDLWDSPGLEDFDRLRPLAYSDTSCFLICYSTSSKPSYQNVVAKWIHEIRHHNSHTPIILVATKTDLRKNQSEKAITQKEGRKLMHQIKANSYVECSAKDRINLNQVFEEAVRCTVNTEAPRNSKFCVLQ